MIKILMQIELQNETKIVEGTINKDNIDYYFPGFNGGVCIIMHSGHKLFLPNSTIREIDKLIKDISININCN